MVIALADYHCDECGEATEGVKPGGGVEHSKGCAFASALALGCGGEWARDNGYPVKLDRVVEMEQG